jgi:hypothetical protein
MKFLLLFLINIIKIVLIENKNIFVRSTIPITGWCRRYRGYNITIYGHVKQRMRFPTTWYPTFISPLNVEATCKMSGVTDLQSDAVIECIISTKIVNTDVILSKLISDDFEDLILDEDDQLVDYNVTCTESTGSIFYLTFKKTLIFIVFFLLF